MSQVAEIFRALGDPVRLEMVRRLVDGQRRTIGHVSEGLGVTRQGARKHLQVLVDAELVRLEPKGRDVIVELDPASLDEAKRFIDEISRRWDTRLLALKEFLETDDR